MLVSLFIEKRLKHFWRLLNMIENVCGYITLQKRGRKLNEKVNEALDG